MAIRFVYPTSGMVGAYGAGQSAARNRQQKYALDMLNQERQRRYRMEEMLAQDYLIGRRQQQMRDWHVEDMQLERKWQEADIQRQRDWRVADLQQAHDWQVEDAQQQRDWHVEDMGAQQEAMNRRDERLRDWNREENRIAESGRMFGATVKRDEEDIASGAYSKADADALRKVNQEIANTRSSNRFSDEAERQKQLDILAEKRDKIYERRLPPPTPEQQFQQDNMRIDVTTGKAIPWGAPSENAIIVPRGDNGRYDLSKAYDPQEKARKEAEIRRKEEESRTYELYKKAEEYARKDSEKSSLNGDQYYNERRQYWMQQFGVPEGWKPIGAQPAPQPAPQAAPQAAPQLPPGAKMLPDGKIMGPDGTIWERE